MTATFTAPATVDQLLTLLGTIPTSREAKGEGWSTEWEHELGDGTNTRPIAFVLRVEVEAPLANDVDHWNDLEFRCGTQLAGWDYDTYEDLGNDRYVMVFSAVAA